MILFQSVGVIIKISFQGSLEPKKNLSLLKGNVKCIKERDMLRGIEVFMQITAKLDQPVSK